MALVSKGIGSGIDSQDVNAYFQILQGLMNDTPVSIGNLLSALGSDLVSNDLQPPTGVSVAPHGTTGAASHTYTVISRNASGDSATTATAVITNSNATLNTTNYNIISWARQAGATSYVILRDGLVINTVADAGGSPTGMTYNDQGGTGSTYTALSVIPPGGRVKSGRGLGAGFLSLAGTNNAAGPPTTGAWLLGDVVMDTQFQFWVCTVAGSPGTWQRIGADSGWATPTLGGSWVQSGGGTLTAGYRLQGNRVTLRGGLNSGSGNGTSPFTLPAGYRPSATVSPPMGAFNGTTPIPASCQILSSGVVAIYYGSGMTAVFLDGVSFTID